MNLDTEEVLLNWENIETPTRTALILMGIEIAKKRLLERDPNGD